jgi:hypothetical protein
MPPLTDVTHVVAVDGLNFRSEPVAVPRTRRAVLRRGDPVRRIGASRKPGWWEIEAMIGGSVARGFVAHQYLGRADTTPAPQPTPAPAQRLRPAILAEDRTGVTRDARGGAYAYPLGERGRPARKGATPAERAESLHAIVRWLEVDRRARYAPAGGRTYCNVYAADYCYLAGAYLPRVWWTGRALERLAMGETVEATYERTVTEMTANMLFRWLDDFGPRFGWTRTFDLDVLQDAANGGGVALICAQRTDLQAPGHITAVVPEAAGHAAARRGGRVAIPLQSQAGSRCYQFGCAPPAWWNASKYRESGFWHHQ